MTDPEQTIEVIDTIINKVTEQNDNFVYEKILPYCTEITQTFISKKLLNRALYCFQKEHPEEFKRLQEEAIKTNKEV